jgi:chromosomal replication initiation ATPase DnaA
MITIERQISIDIGRIIKTTPKDDLRKPLLKYIEEKFYPRQAIMERPEENACLRPSLIIGKVAGFYAIGRDALIGPSRKRNIAYARRVCMTLLTAHTRLSLQAIGDMMGNRDHTTVIAARKVLEDEMDVYPEVRREVESLRAQITKSTI